VLGSCSSFEQRSRSTKVAQRSALRNLDIGLGDRGLQDGRKETPFGPAVKGAVSFDGNGKFTLMIIGADLPNPSGNPRESSRLAVAYFGTYAVDEAAKTVTYTAERATNPGFDGLARKASVTVSGDELMQAGAPITSPQGTFTPNLVLIRAK
jgi:hypothetical protein